MHGLRELYGVDKTTGMGVRGMNDSGPWLLSSSFLQHIPVVPSTIPEDNNGLRIERMRNS